MESPIFELQRNIWVLEQDIKNLTGLAAARVAVEAAAAETPKNSWGTWVLSPLYRQAQEDEHKNALKARRCQQRDIEITSKERRLGLQEALLQEKEKELKTAEEAIDAANLAKDEKIRGIEARVRNRKFPE